jgi:hypothetical protein
MEQQKNYKLKNIGNSKKIFKLIAIFRKPVKKVFYCFTHTGIWYRFSKLYKLAF